MHWESPAGAGRRLIYHFMFGPSREVGCPGCSMFVDQIGHSAHLNARDTAFAAVSRAPIGKIEAYRRRMGWAFPWVSSFGTDFNPDLGVGPREPQPHEAQDGEEHGLSVFLRDGTSVFRTYFTTARGVERLGSVWTLLDTHTLRPAGDMGDLARRMAAGPPYEWWRRHDEYKRKDAGSA